MKSELLPCPFCGGEARTHYVKGYELWEVSCGQCGVELSSYLSEADAINAWNRRAEESRSNCEVLRSNCEVQQWIPVTERMPETEGTYLTFCRYRDGDTVQKLKLWKGGAFTSEPRQVLFWRELPADPEVTE